MSVKNLFSINKKPMEDEFFENIIENDNFQLERIISYGQTTPKGKWYDQDKNEWVSLLQGKATIVFYKGKKIDLLAGDYITIAAHHKHRVEYTSNDAIWLTIHFDSKK